MGRRRPGPAAGLVALALAILALTGCAGIPLDTPVVAATGDENDDTNPVQIEARPPQPGATPTQIVEGFLDAMSSYEREFPIAQQFLTPAARDAWNRPVIEVYTRTTTETTPTQPSVVRLLYDRAARIDEEGMYTGEPSGEPQERALRLEEDEDGEWRIADLPNILLISSLDLINTYSPFTTYFPDPEGQVLVPDQVWLPAVEPQIALLLAEAVVDGPTAMVGRGVQNAFPLGTTVTSATASGPIVTVSLSGSTIGATDAGARRLMVAQLSATIRFLGVERVDIDIGGEVVEVPDISRDLDPLADFAAPPVYLLTDTNAVLSADPDPPSGFAQVAGVLGRGELAARSLAVSLDRTVAATVDETGSTVSSTPLREDGAPSIVYGGQDVAPPSYDRYGNLWLVDRKDSGSEIKLVRDGDVTAVAAPDLSEGRISHLKVAPDGVRVAVVSEGAGAVLQLGLIIRGDAPVIDLTVAIAFEGTGLLDVAWAGATELLVVVTTDGLPRPYSVSVDGSTTIEGSQTGIVSVAAYATRPAAYALTDVANVLRQTSVLRWDQVATGGKLVTYPG